MSTLLIKYATISEITKHPNADRLQIAKIGGWTIVVGKDTFKKGDAIIFLPPDAVLPEHIHEGLGITKYLAELPKGYGEGVEADERPTARGLKLLGSEVSLLMAPL